MILKIGIIGLPNVGKSLLFNKLTKSNIKVGNFYFTTLQPNINHLPMYNQYLYKIKNILKDHVVIPNRLELFDLAGIIEDAHKGAGLGNNFFSYLHNIDYLIHVVRFFKDKNIYHIYGNIDPIRDIDIVNIELLLYDIKLCERYLKKVKIEKNIKNINTKKTLFKKCLDNLNQNIFLRQKLSSFEDEEIKILKELGFITVKPIIYFLNIQEDQKDNIYKYNNIKDIIKIQNNFLIYLTIKELEYKNNYYYIKRDEIYINDIYKNIQDIIIYIFNSFNLKNFFTIQKLKLTNWVYTKKISIVEGAKMVHSDFCNFFIKAIAINAQDFIKKKGIIDIKKYKNKNYVIKNNDIITFKI